MNPNYPIYIVSKGRWKSRYTVKALNEMNVPYLIVIEPTEYDQYSAVIDPTKILVLPFHDLGQGSIPARNWIWEHSLAAGYKRHWILDDNIEAFYRPHKNQIYYATSGTIFKAAEDFADRYTNVAIAGFEYKMFSPRNQKREPIRLNTRVYSCLLILNDLPYRWRGRYNEDTDLSLQVLKAGYCTLLFNAFLAGKKRTMTIRGGNTDELYKGDGRLKMAQALQELHPDVVTIQWRWNRWQHLVDYSRFRHNKLIKHPDAPAAPPNNYGIKLVAPVNNEKE